MASQITTPERFWSKVNFGGPVPAVRPELGPCWLWTAACHPQGHGLFMADGRRRHPHLVYAHRWAYEFCVGPIPEGLTIDHLCRVRPCVNPDHLEPVTLLENIQRGEAGKWQRSANCLRGHPLSGDNLYNYGGLRHCRTCRTEASRRYKARKIGERKE